MIRYNKTKHCYEWDRWRCENWTKISDWLAKHLVASGEAEYAGTTE